MKLSSANILRSGKREIRALNDPCDASCFVWFSCGNSVPDGTCRGFALMNHQTRTHLNRILNEDDSKYIENCVSTIQRGVGPETEEGIVREVLRYLPHQEPRREGFLGMLEASCGIPNTPTPERIDPEERASASSEFQTMLSAFQKQRSSYRRTHESGFMAMCEVARPSRTSETVQPEPQTQLGFLRMLGSKHQASVSSGSHETVSRIPCGFGEMLDAAFSRNPMTSDEKPRVWRGMGFVNMLRGATRGTTKE